MSRISVFLVLAIFCPGCSCRARPQSASSDEKSSEKTAGENIGASLKRIEGKLDKAVTADDLFDVDKSSGKKTIKKELLPSSSPGLTVSVPATSPPATPPPVAKATMMIPRTSTEPVANIGTKIDDELVRVQAQEKERKIIQDEITLQAAEDRENKAKLQRMKEALKPTPPPAPPPPPAKKMPEASWKKGGVSQQPSAIKCVPGPDPMVVALVHQNMRQQQFIVAMQYQAMYNTIWYQQQYICAQVQAYAINSGAYGPYARQMVYYGAHR